MISRVLGPLLLAVLLVFAGVESAAAQSASAPDVRISFTTDRSELTVGDVAILSLVVSHPEGLVVVLPRIEREWGPFEVQEQSSVQTTSITGGIKTIAKQFRVVLFSPGAFATPDLPISVRNTDGSVEQIFPDPVNFTVRSVLSGPDDELRDIRPPADLSTPLWQRPVILVLFGLAIVGACGAVGYYFYRRSHTKVSPPVTVLDTRKPWEVALQELDRIDRLDLPGRSDLKEHYTLVAGVLRTYLGATYLREVGQADALDMSTEEINEAISLSELDDRHSREVVELLREADLVKFANQSLPLARAREVIDQIRRFVEVTKSANDEVTPQQVSPAPVGGTT